jgi:hypothetical protein
MKLFIENKDHKSLFPLFGIILITFFLSIPLLPFWIDLGHDKQVYLYGGMSIYKGNFPYVNFFDHKPPLIYVFVSIIWPLKHWGVFILQGIIKVIAAREIFFAASRLNIKQPLLFSCIFLVLLLCPFILGAGLLTREFTACFIAISLTIVLGKGKYKYFFAGIFAGLIFHTQQEEVLIILPSLCYLIFLDLLHKRGGDLFNEILKRSGFIFCGFALVTLPLLIWIISHNALTAYWQQTFLFNILVYGDNDTWQMKVDKIISVLFHTRYLFFIVPVIFCHLYFMYKNKERKLNAMLLATWITAIITKTFLGGITNSNMPYHYLLSYSTLVTISIMIIIRNINIYYFPFRVPFLPGIILIFLLMWKNSFSRIYNLGQNNKDFSLLLKKFENIRNHDGQLYVMGNASFLALNNELNILAPTKWIYQNHLNNQRIVFDPKNHVLYDILTGLEKNKTLYVIDFYRKKSADQLEFRKKWIAYIEKNYNEEENKENYIIYKRKPLDNQ